MKILKILKPYVISICVVFFTALLASAFSTSLKTDPIWSTVLADIVMLFFCAGQYLTIRNKNKDTDFSKAVSVFSGKKLLVTAGIAFVFSCFALIAMNYLIAAVPDEGMTSRNDVFSSHSSYLIGFVSIVLAPVFEEIMYRLYIYNYTKHTSHWLPAMLFTSVLFASQHGTVAHMIVAPVLSICLIVAYEACGRKIYVPMLCHMIYNCMAFFSIPTRWMTHMNSTVVLISFMFMFAICVFCVCYFQFLHTNARNNKIK